jgi:hypothetical protein
LETEKHKRNSRKVSNTINEEFHELPENLTTWYKITSSRMEQQCCVQVLLEVCTEPRVFNPLRERERRKTVVR